MTQIPALASIQDAARLLNVSTKTLRRWESRGVLVPIRTEGGHRRYDLERIKELKGNRRRLRISNASASNLPEPKLEPKDIPVLYESLHIDQKRILKLTAFAFTATFLMFVTVKLTPAQTMDMFKTKIMGLTASNENNSPEKDSRKELGMVLAESTSSALPKFSINIESAFRQNSHFAKDVEIDGNLILQDQIIGNVDLTGVVIVGGNSISTGQNTFNLINSGASTLNIGGAATSVNIGANTGTTNINNSLLVDGATNLTGAATLASTLGVTGATTLSSTLGVTGKITGSGDLSISGNTTLSGTAAVTGKITGSGELEISGNAKFGDITSINGVTYDFPSSQGGSDTFLKNNGSGTLTWATPTLTAASLTGVVPIANGGTNNSTAYTAGSVIFSDGTKLTQDNSNLFYDDSNNRLAIGNTSPSVALDVTGAGSFSSTLTASNGLTLTTGALNLTSTSGTSSLTSTATSGNSFAFTNNALSSTNSNLMLLTYQNANTGAGTTANGLRIVASGSTPSSGENTQNLISLSGNTLGSNTFNGIYFNTGLSNYVQSSNWEVTAAGAQTIASDLAVNGGSITTTQTTANIFNTNATTLNVGGAATTINLGQTSGTVNIAGNTALGNATTDSVSFTARVAQDSDLIPIGTTGTNDLGSASLPWDNVYATTFTQNGNLVCDASGANCPSGSTQYWSLANGALYPVTNSSDILIGGSATASAKFAFKNVISGTPTASISGTTTNVATYLDGEGNLSTTNAQGLTIGSSTTGNVVINSRGSTALTANGANLTAGGTLTLPNTNTLSGVTNYVQSSTGFSVGGATTYYLDGSGNLNANAGTFAGNVAVNGGNLTTTQTTANLFTNATTLGIGAGSGTTTINNTLAVTGASTLNGNSTLGDAITDTITFTGRVAQDSDLLPIGTTGTNDLGSASLPWDNVYATVFTQNGNLVCDASGANCPAGATQYWGLASGALYGLNNTTDLLIGGSATASAKFAFKNVVSGTPTASISGTTTNVATYLDGEGNLSTTNAQGLTLGSSTTGNVVINSRGSTALTANGANLTASGTLTLPNTNTLSGVTNYVQSSTGYSVGGATTYYLDGSGNLNANGGTFAGALAANGNSTLGDAITDTITFTGRVAQDNDLLPIGTTGTNDLGSASLPWDNVYANAFTQNGNLVCDASGANCPVAGSGGSKWRLTSGAIAPFTDTLDVLIGSTATSSAKFAFKNVASGTPTATISGSTTNVATYLDGEGNLSTTNMAALTLGSSTTGNVVLNSRGSSALTANGANLTTTGTFTLPNSNTLTGQTNFVQTSGGYSVGGATTYYLDSSGNLNANAGTFAGALLANGNSTLGDAITDTITFGGRVAQDSDLLPIGTTGTNDLGSASLPWDNVYGTSLYQNGNAVCDTSGNCLASVNYFQLNNKILSPANSTYDLTIGGTATGSAFQVFGVETASGGIAKLTSTVTTTGNVIEATASAITSGNLVKLGTGGNNGNFSGNGILMDFDNTGGNSFTGNFVKFDNAGSQKFLVDSSGNVTLAGTTLTASSLDSFVTANSLALGSTTTLTLGGSATINGGTGASGTLTLVSTTNGSKGNIQFFSSSNAIDSSGNLTIAGDLTVNGNDINSAGSGSGSIFNSGVTTLNIGGAATSVGIGASSGTTTINNALAVTGASTLNGNITLGDAITDTLTFTGRVAQDSDLLPIGTTGTNDLGSASLPWDNVYANTFTQNGNLVCDASGANCPVAGSGGSKWRLTSGAITPFTDTLDVLIGSTATTSAKFAFKNVASGTPTASISGTTTNVATYLDGEGNLSTTNAQGLTIGSSTTGNVVINSRGSSALTANGANLTTTGTFTLPNSNTLTGQTNFVQTSGGYSVGGATTYYLDSSGNLNANGGTFAGALAANGNSTLGDAITDTITFTGRVAQDNDLLPIGTTGTNDLGSASLPWDNVYATTFTQNGNTVCDTSGNCLASGNYLQLNNKILSPGNSTYDLAVGGTATGSAFQVFGIEKAADATSRIAKINSSTITTGTLLEATASAITSGNIVKLGTGGNNGNFTGNGILMDFDNTGGNSFTGNFLKFDNAASTKLTVDSSGNIALAAGSGLDTITAGTLGIGTTTANAVSISKTGVTTTVNGSLTSTQTLTASNGLTLTTGALNLTSTSGTSSLTSTATSGDSFAFTNSSLDTASSNLANFTVKNNNTASAGLAVSGVNISGTGSAPLSGTNTTNLLNLSATALASNTFNGINFGNGLTNYINGTNFTVTAAGNVSALGGMTVSGGTINLNATGTSSTNIGNTTGTTTFAGHILPATTDSTNLGSSASVQFNNIYANAFLQDGNAVCDASGTGCPSGGSGGSKWKLSSGAISPFSDTLDVLIGNSATTSAKFAFKNVASGIPTASVSGTTANVAAFLTGEGNLATTNMAALNLGGSTTGNVVINSRGNASLTANGIDLTAGGDLAVNGGDITTSQTTATLFNTTATTLSLGGAATTLNVGPTGSGASSILLSGGSADTGCTLDGSTGNLTCAGDLAANGGDLTTSASTATLFNSTATTLSLGGAATTLNIGPTGSGASSILLSGGSADTGCTLDGSTGNLTCAGDLAANGGDLTTSASTATLFNSTATTLSLGGAATTLNVGPTGSGASSIVLSGGSADTGCTLDGSTGNLTCAGDLAANGGDLTTSATTATLFNSTATTLSLGGAATTALNIGNGTGNYTAINIGSSTGTHTINIAGTGATAADTINIGTGGTGADTINIGSSASTTALNLTSGTGAQTFASSVVSGTTTSSAFVFTGNALTTGTGMYLNSSSITTGTLLSLNASSTTLTTGKLLDIQNNSSSVFSVGASQITSALPHQFTAAGDVTMAYDLIFTNQTASVIDSYGPLTLRAGESFESNNLTLKTYNSGNIIFDQDVNGKVLVGTGSATLKFTVSDAQSATAAAMIENTYNGTDADGLAIKLGFTGSGNANNRFITFMNGVGTVQGKIRSAGTTVSYDTGGVDMAEYFLKDDSFSPEPGDVVRISDATERVNKTNNTYDPRMVGVISETPGFTGGIDGPDKALVALVGQVKVKIDPASPAIAAGDYLTSSPVTGRAMKSVKAGAVVAKALESWSPGSGKDKILSYINVSYHDPEAQLTNSGNLNIAQDNANPGYFKLTDGNGNEINKLSGLTGLITTAFNAIQGSVDNLLVKVGLVSPEVLTRDIKPLAGENNINITLGTATDSGSLAIKNSEGETVSSFDSTGNATFSGQINSETASISGALYASTIYADQIISKEGKFGDTSTNTLGGITREQIENLLKSVEEDQVLAAQSQNWNPETATDSAMLNELNLKDLYVTGIAAFDSINVSNNVIFAGELAISKLTNEAGSIISLDTIDSPLSLQSAAAQPLYIMAGKVKIDIDGNMQVLGDLDVGGVLSASAINIAEDPNASVSATLEGNILNSLATAGDAAIATGSSEIKIINPNIKNESLIFVTPTSQTTEALYVKSKADGNAVVGFKNATAEEVKFNWWIVNLVNGQQQ